MLTVCDDGDGACRCDAGGGDGRAMTLRWIAIGRFLRTPALWFVLLMLAAAMRIRARYKVLAREH
jgi:hypothetical protein